jgi:hypothetical protein
MKTIKFLFLTIFTGMIFGSCENSYEFSSDINTNAMSLYWHHEVFGEEGRYLLFEFYGTEALENSYKFIFDYTVDNQNIIVTLVDIIDEGKPQKFPGWDTLCLPRGNFHIPEKILQKNTYNFILNTPNFSVSSLLTISQGKITLDIPENSHFTSSIKEVYPIPANLLFGSVVYDGSQNTQAAMDFIENLSQLNLQKATLPDYPYRYLDVDTNGNAIDSHWEPDNHSLGLLYESNEEFSNVVEIAKYHFNKSDINIYLFSGKGDQAHLNKIDGINIVFGKY